MFQAGVAGAKLRTEQFVAVEVDESDSLVSKWFLVTALGEHQLSVTLMTGALGHHDRSGPQATKPLLRREPASDAC